MQSGGTPTFPAVSAPAIPFSKRTISRGMDVVTRELIPFKYNNVAGSAA